MRTALIQTSPVASMIYEMELEEYDNSWLSYVYSLLVIAGADGEVSEEEMEWMQTELLEELGATERQRKFVKHFDYANADLKGLLNDVKGSLPLNFRRALVYDAVQMARADDDYAPEEREAVMALAKMLDVPFYLAKTIEGLVNTERSIEVTRKSMFEVEDRPYKQKSNYYTAASHFRRASVSDRHTFGINFTCDNTQLNYGYALMVVAGADQEVSKSERDWFKNEFAVLSAVPSYIVDDVLAYDYRRADLEAIIAEMEVDISINFARTLLYNAVKMARADENYPEAEKRAVKKAAELLHIEDDVAKTIEYLVDTEIKISNMRKILFQQQDENSSVVSGF